MCMERAIKEENRKKSFFLFQGTLCCIVKFILSFKCTSSYLHSAFRGFKEKVELLELEDKLGP